MLEKSWQQVILWPWWPGLLSRGGVLRIILQNVSTDSKAAVATKHDQRDEGTVFGADFWL